MKKFGLVLVTLMVVAAIGFVGCAGGPRHAPGEGPEFSFDLEGLGIQTRNEEALAGRWADLLIMLPEIPDVDFTAFSRVTIVANYFNEAGEQIPHQDDMVMVTLVYDPAGDIRGPEMGPGPNTPLKQFNVGGGSGSVHRERGSILRLTRQPMAVLLQNANAMVRYIELVELTFHNR